MTQRKTLGTLVGALAAMAIATNAAANEPLRLGAMPLNTWRWLLISWARRSDR